MQQQQAAGSSNFHQPPLLAGPASAGPPHCESALATMMWHMLMVLVVHMVLTLGECSLGTQCAVWRRTPSRQGAAALRGAARGWQGACRAHENVALIPPRCCPCRVRAVPRRRTAANSTAPPSGRSKTCSWCSSPPTGILIDCCDVLGNLEEFINQEQARGRRQDAVSHAQANTSGGQRWQGIMAHEPSGAGDMQRIADAAASGHALERGSRQRRPPPSRD
eukprot:SAG25_NODE_985_length_4405_cov_223.335810_7_plen_221_part_00